MTTTSRWGGMHDKYGKMTVEFDDEINCNPVVELAELPEEKDQDAPDSDPVEMEEDEDTMISVADCKHEEDCEQWHGDEHDHDETDGDDKELDHESDEEHESLDSYFDGLREVVDREVERRVNEMIDKDMICEEWVPADSVQGR